MMELVLICRTARPPTTSMMMAAMRFCHIGSAAPSQMTDRYWPAPRAMELGMTMTEINMNTSDTKPSGRPRHRETSAHSPPVTGKAVPASA